MSTDTPAPTSATLTAVSSDRPDLHAMIFGGFEASTEIEAHIMTEAASVLHHRLCEELDALPWWRVGARRGLALALVTTGGACFEWAEDADRLAEAGPS